ncbi:MAG: glycosyltransferase family 4 protein [Thermodesulfobacteriota bacterium]
MGRIAEMKFKVGIVATLDISLDKLHPGLFDFLVRKNYGVVAISAEGPYLTNVRDQGARVIPVPMTRSFTVFRDLWCLWRLYRIFKEEGLDLVHFSTPKAGLLASLAACLAGCPNRLYTLRGLGYMAFSGFKRTIGRWCEKAACSLSTHVIAISTGLQEEALRENLVNPTKVLVQGQGSSRGVDLKKFHPAGSLLERSRKLRAMLGIQEGEVLIGYAGRITPEKGILILVKAFMQLLANSGTIHLALVGDNDQRAPVDGEILEELRHHPKIHLLPFTDRIEEALSAMDVLVLPSFREGFGNVLIEAAALEKPVVASDIPGCRNALLPGITGLLSPAGDSTSLASAIEVLVRDPMRRKKMGQEGRRWVTAHFDRCLVWERLERVYRSLLTGDTGSLESGHA